VTGVHFITVAVRDRVMKKSLTNFQGGLEWVDGNKLCDLDYADVIALTETSQMGMQLMTEEVEKISKCIRETSKHLEKQEYQPRRENRRAYNIVADNTGLTSFV